MAKSKELPYHDRKRDGQKADVAAKAARVAKVYRGESLGRRKDEKR